MTSRLLSSVLALLLLPALAIARPSRSDVGMNLSNAIVDPYPDRTDFACNTGGPTSLLAGAAALGLILRRRR